MAKILVVDDEKIIREEFQEIIREFGHEVDVARGGREALEMIRVTDYDLVFLDVLMPQMEGRQVFEEIKKIKPTRVAFMSGYLPANKEKEALKLGAVACLSKPLDLEKVRQLIEGC